MNNPLHDLVTAEYRARFGAEPAFVVRAPGRVNLIGEHTDYNDGFVFPMAIDRAVWFAVGPRDDAQVLVYSADFRAVHGFTLASTQVSEPPTSGPDGEHGWIDYIQGTAWALGQLGAFPLLGWQGVMAGDVPIGAGLSSSAAAELAAARAFYERAAALDPAARWDPAAMARACQRAENRWVGVNSGIMDQMISAAGEAGHALLIDCRSLETRPAPLPPGTVAVILDTNTRRELVTSAYNERRAQCEAAARFFGVAALRDVSEAAFTAREAALAAHDPLAMRRARHIVTENARTLAAFEAMTGGDAAALGLLMNASHDSLRDDFEVTNDALNQIVTIARAQPGCYGARMTGAGFGGCAVALVDEAQAPAFTAAVSAAYRAVAERQAAVYISRPAAGASRVA
jgi:galactokinase